VTDNYPVTTSQGHTLSKLAEMQKSDLRDESVAQLINKLERQNLGVDPQTAGLRVTELQESLEMYERLAMKQEYTYTFRMLLIVLLH
jgi:hypothetical protein